MDGMIIDIHKAGFVRVQLSRTTANENSNGARPE
jgi:hypothetical protein